MRRRSASALAALAALVLAPTARRMDAGRRRATFCGRSPRRRPVRGGPASRHRRRRRRRRDGAGARTAAWSPFAGTCRRTGSTVTIAPPTATPSRSRISARSPSQGRGRSRRARGSGTVGPSGTPERRRPYVHLGVRTAGDPNGYLDPPAFLPARAPRRPLRRRRHRASRARPPAASHPRRRRRRTRGAGARRRRCRARPPRRGRDPARRAAAARLPRLRRRRSGRWPSAGRGGTRPAVGHAPADSPAVAASGR